MGDELRFVSGWVLVRGGLAPGRSVRIRVKDARGAAVTQAVSLPDGQFAVAVPPASAVVVEAVGASGTVLGQHEVRGNGPTVLILRRALPEEDASEARLLTGAAADLAGRIARFEAAGQLPPGARGILDAVLERLAWLDGLLKPARRAILGDTMAAAVVREALSAWAGEVPCPPPVRKDFSSPNVEERDDAAPAVPDTLVSVNAIATMASAILTAGRTFDEQIDMADGLGAVLSARGWLETLAGAAAAGDVPAMRVMMGAPGPMPMGIPGLGLPGGGLPSGGSAAFRQAAFRACLAATPVASRRGPDSGCTRRSWTWSNGSARPPCFRHRTRSAA